jgi:tetratricopeptide (TPR) repeat protein
MKDKTEEYLNQLDLAKKSCPSDPRLRVKIIINIANECQNLGQYFDALCYLNNALDIQLLHYSYDGHNLYNVINSDSFEIANTLFHIEFLHYIMGFFSSALELAHIRLISYTKLYPNIPNILISDTMITVGILFKELKEYDKALYYFYQAVNLRTSIYELKNYNVPSCERFAFSNILNFIEFTHHMAGHYNEALELCENRLILYKATHGYFHKVVSDTMVTMANLYFSIENYEYSLSNLQEALFISNTIRDYHASCEIIIMINEINGKVEHSKNSAELDNSHSIQLNDIQRAFNSLYPYTITDVERDGNCFFRAAALSLEFPQSIYGLLKDETVIYIKNNLDSFYEFSKNIDIEIDYLSREGGWVDNLSIQAFVDTFQVHIRLYNIHGDNFANITSRTSNQDISIRLLYYENHYMPIFDYTINDNSNYLNQEYNQTHITYIDGPSQEEQFDSEVNNVSYVGTAEIFFPDFDS